MDRPLRSARARTQRELNKAILTDANAISFGSAPADCNAMRCDSSHNPKPKPSGRTEMRARGAIEAQLTRKELPYCCGSRSVAEDRVLGNARYSGTRSWKTECSAMHGTRVLDGGCSVPSLGPDDV